MTKATFEIICNGDRLNIETPQLTGEQIRALFGVDPAMDLVVEGAGSDPDRILSDYEVVSLRTGPVRIFLRPPTSFGGPVS
jgi:hypothetical protein